MNDSTLWYLESVDLYKILCPHKIRDYEEKHEFIKFNRGQHIYIPQEPSMYIYLVAEGSVKISNVDAIGNEITHYILSKGEVFGELAVAGESRRKDFAVAMENTLICRLTVNTMKSLMYDNKELSLKILKLMGLRVMKIERNLERLIFKNARTRVVEFLKDIAHSKGRKFGFDTAVFVSLTHKDIASLTGTSRQTVTTILNTLKEQNLISINRKRILIRDLQALK